MGSVASQFTINKAVTSFRLGSKWGEVLSEKFKVIVLKQDMKENAVPMMMSFKGGNEEKRQMCDSKPNSIYIW